MKRRVLHLAILLSLVSALVVGGVNAGSQGDSVVAVISLGTPRPLSVVVEGLKNSGAVSIYELFHVYQGRANVYTGGMILPAGEDVLSVSSVVLAVHTAMLNELLERNDLPQATRADLEDRLLATATSGPSVYGVTVSGPANVVRGLRTALRAQRIEVVSERRVLPSFPPDCYPVPNRSTEPEYVIQSLIPGREWAPSSGYLHTYTDASGYRCFYNTLTWNSEAQLDYFGPSQGYEHDVVTYYGDGLRWAAGLQSTSRPTGWDSNMPMPYLDYVTIDDDPDYPTYTVGTFRVCYLVPSTQYYTFLRAYQGNSQSDPNTKINGQRTNVYAYSPWLVFPVEPGAFLVTNFTIPGTQYWTFNP